MNGVMAESSMGINHYYEPWYLKELIAGFQFIVLLNTKDPCK